MENKKTNQEPQNKPDPKVERRFSEDIQREYDNRSNSYSYWS